MESPTWEIVQVFNNNVVLACEQVRRRGQHEPTRQAVLVGTGIGFGARRGQTVDSTKIHEVFSPLGYGKMAQVATLLSEIPIELLTLARELADVASLLCGITVTDSFVIMLADHINAAIDRAIQGISLPNPWQWEMRQFYPREYEFGLRALALIKQATGVQLEEVEASSIGQHAVNAHFAGFTGKPTGEGKDGAEFGESFATTARMTELMAQTLEVVEASLGEKLDRNSMATARFVTHLRYLLQRMLGDRKAPHVPDPGLLMMAESMQQSHPQAYRIAGLIVIKLESALDTKCSEDEILYLTLHVARLMMKV